MKEGYGLQGFEEVWRRVTGETEKEPDEAACLRGYMDDERADSAYYAAMAARCRGVREKRLFSRLSAEEAGHLRRLQTAYFMLAGDTYVPRSGRVRIDSMLDALRARHAGETALAETYSRAALSAKNVKLKKLYSSLAADELRHASLLEDVIKNAMR